MNDFTDGEITFIEALKIYEKGDNNNAQVLIELALCSTDNRKYIDLNIFYLQVLMAKRLWSYNKLKENEKKGIEHISKVRENFEQSFDERQSKKWKELKREFIFEFQSYVRLIDIKRVEQIMEPWHEEDLEKLSEKYNLK